MLPASTTTPATAASPSLSSETAHAALPTSRSRRTHSQLRDSFVQAVQQEKALQSDAKYRKYAAAVEKTLQAFDHVNEWADFITFLAKLLKCLQSAPQFPVIPHKLIVAKRLSQCLNPALPTGVHQRALDVYTHILTTIGPENLRRDLPAWSSGLFPFFQYAATSVKPIVLNIYERFYLPLQEELRPATKAFLLALLPGLEEETGEWFEKVAALLDRLSGTVSPSFFFQNVWLVLITAPNSRIPALNYLARRLPRADDAGTDALDTIVGHDVGLMVRGFAAALEDDKILVQRAILDLLLGTLRIDGASFRSCRFEDQILLTRAVLAVVLRRDLSLSRRLYTWLLGPSDSSETQLAFLRTHGLDLLAAALRQEMHDGLRGFKVFISLLDKWEIGALLTERCVVDAAKALRAKLDESDSDELLMTGNMLFEVLDPFLLWKQLYKALRAELAGEETSQTAVELARFVVRTFRMHDDEVLRLHAPVVGFALLDLVRETLDTRLSSGADGSANPEILATAVSLATELLAEVPPAFFAPVPSSETEGIPTGAALAALLYTTAASSSLSTVAASDDGVGTLSEPAELDRASLPPIEARAILSAGLARALELVEASDTVPELLHPAANAVELLLDLTAGRPLDSGPDAAEEVEASELEVRWDSRRWVETVLKRLDRREASVASFEGDKALVRLVLRLSSSGHSRPGIRPRIGGAGKVAQALAERLLAYLLPGASPCYLEAVQLLWAVETLSPGRRILEGIIARRLGSDDALERERAFEAFGNLWRFTEDAQLPGVLLRNPMFATLDALKSDDLSVRRAAEAWMRCSLKSYIRVLDPLLLGLLDPSIAAQSETIKVGGVRVPILVYERAFDQARVHHVLDNLLALARFGGQGFVRIAKGSWLKHTLDPALRERVIAADLETHTYLDGMIVLLLRFLRADSNKRLAPSLGPLNAHIHAAVAELLQVLISRGESELASLPAIESSLTVRLFLSVHRGELDLQNKLLHVLHSVIHAITTVPSRRGHQPTASTTSAGTSAMGQAQQNDAQPPDLTHDEFFVRVLSDAIQQPANAVLHHWIDFLLMTIPQYRHALHSVILPLVDQLIARLEALVEDFRGCYLVAPNVDRLKSAASSATDAEFTVITNALERLLLIAVSESVPASGEDENRAADRAAGEGATSGGGGAAGGLLGYMTGVLSHQELETGDIPEQVKAKHVTLQRVRDAVDLLLTAWDVTTALDAGIDDDRSNSQAHFAVRVRVRARRALERIHKAVPNHVLEDLVGYWSRRCRPVDEREQRVFAMLQVLHPSPQGVVASLCEKLNPKHAASKHPSPYLASEDVTFDFLEAYINGVEGAVAVQVWSALLGFTRDVLSNQSSSRALIFPTLRLFTALSEKVSQTSALEDRRLRRDLQDTFVRLADATVQIAGRAGESGSWLKKAVPEPGVLNGDTESVKSEKLKDERSSVVDVEKKPGAQAGDRLLVREISDFLAQRVVPDLRRFLVDADKTAAVCSNIVYYIVGPAFKTRSKTFEADPTIFALLLEMTKNPQTLKAWRSLVADAFADNRFFNASPRANADWRPLVQALMQSDKERFAELSAKISTASSANIFTNRELESLSRALSLRRLTYVLLSGPKDRYLNQLPVIQEKVVDLLRSPVGDMVHAEVYLCLRVLFCRIDNQHLAGLWPVILTELLRLFESLVDQTVPDGSDLLQLVFSACKFLDITLVLQTEEFQIHEWMFVTDTVDAMYPPDPFLPQAVMDRLGEILEETASVTDLASTTKMEADRVNLSNPNSALIGEDGVGAETQGPAARRPLLSARRIHSIHELRPFFTTVSLSAYESIYRAGNRVDWAAVEQSLERDVFEGEGAGGKTNGSGGSGLPAAP